MGGKESMRVTGMLIALVILIATAGCRDGEPQGEASATDAYVEAFGEPPTPKQGSCFARVGYMPLKEKPEQVVPVPFFLFSEDGQLFKLTERLIEMEHVYPLREELFNPFPEGTALRAVNRDNGVVTVELAFTAQKPTPGEVSAMSRAITLTMGQFADIQRARLLSEGEPLPGTPDEGSAPDPSWQVEPGEPALLLVAGNWNESDQLKEILIISTGR